jgi:sugar lactone lactonase YvrE
VRRLALTVLLASALTLVGGQAIASPPHHDVQGDDFPSIIHLPIGFQPEGISIGKGTTFYVGSVANGSIYRGDVRTGDGALLVPGIANTAAVGTEVDGRNRLWVSGGAGGNGRVYDAKSGALLATYDFRKNFPGLPTFINDVVVTKDAAYFTDSSNAELYVVPLSRGGRLPAADGFTVLPLTGDFVLQPGFNLNGIEASQDGRTLLVVQSNTGKLFAVPVKTGFATKVDLGSTTLTNGDGLLRRGSILYVVQNQLNQIAALRLDRKLTSGRLIDTITNDNFKVPTTIAAFGQSLYAVNARFGEPNPQTLDYTVVKASVR